MGAYIKEGSFLSNYARFGLEGWMTEDGPDSSKARMESSIMAKLEALPTRPRRDGNYARSNSFPAFTSVLGGPIQQASMIPCQKLLGALLIKKALPYLDYTSDQQSHGAYLVCPFRAY